MEQGALTPLGVWMAGCGLAPAVARLVLFGARWQVLRPMAALAALAERSNPPQGGHVNFAKRYLTWLEKRAEKGMEVQDAYKDRVEVEVL